MNRSTALQRFCFMLAACSSFGALAGDVPASLASPNNPALADGICALTHCDGYQTGALPVRGPQGGSRLLSEQEIDLLWESPISAGAFDRRYPDGTQVLWLSKVDRIEKLTLKNNTLTLLQELRLPTNRFPYYSGEDMQRIVAELDQHAPDSAEFKRLAAAWKGYEMEALRAFYGALSRDGTLYTGGRDRVLAYGDQVPDQADSPIVAKGELVFDPARMNKAMPVPLPIIIGFNALHDGHLAIVCMDGTLIVVSPDLKQAHYYRIGDENIWNGLSVDEKGGIYFAGSRKLHKVVWKDGKISDRPEDGAWTEAYEVGPRDKTHRGRRGTGTAPVLMGGPEDRDRFVIIADAADVNNAVLYWRDEIPVDWQPLPGASSRRVAGKLPVDFGDPQRVESYSENAAVVLGYGAVLGDNRPRNGESLTLDVVLRLTDPALTPLGLQKFRWDPEQRRFLRDWVRADVSSPSATPAISAQDGGLHLGTIVDGQWAWLSLDWATGKTRGLYRLGASQRYNPAYIAVQLLPNGDPLYAGFGGAVHLRIGDSGPQPQP